MKLLLEALVVELDEAGHVKSRQYDFSGLVMRLTGVEIDGIHFKLKDLGTSIEIHMEGNGLNEEIVTNYPTPSNSPVKQISFKIPEARFTANVLNKLMRRANKEFPGNALVIRNVRAPIK